MPDDSKRVPFTSMIYMGDGLSDVPCMKMMRAYGGQAIAVYQESNRLGVEDLLAKGRVDFIFRADYSEGTALDATVKDIIRKIEKTDKYRSDYYKYHTGKDWNDSRNYDFCLNTASMSYEKLVAVVKAYIEQYA